MKVPMSWFSDYMDIGGITPKQFADGMTMSGSKVEGVECLGDRISGVVTGRIISVEKHPDADKLKVCMVDVGKETLQIVTGAPNITEESVGIIVPVATHGSKLPDGTKITKGKLRGVESCGMLCSHHELGFSDEDFPDAEYGILKLSESLDTGVDIREVFGLSENIVEFEITSNRPDCLSVIGLAREAAATFDREFHIPKTVFAQSGKANAKDKIQIEIKDTTGCPRYIGRVVENVIIKPSPKWLADRLKAAGVRPINNIVDITNYVMLEYGQPMHAFDLSYLEGNQIIVRRAEAGEKMVTLDEQERVLDEEILVIADSKKAVAVAGVMGAENSEIKENTKTVLFESANFNPVMVRRASKKLGIRTEASSRFEKGLDANNTLLAIERACQLVCELGAGEVLEGVVDVDHSDKKAATIPLRPEKQNEFIGIRISKEEMIRLLEKVGFKVDGDTITVPSFRADVETEADIAEEIARFYGYENIPSTIMSSAATQGYKTREQKIFDIAKNVLTNAGLYEIITYSFTSPKIFDDLCLDREDKLREAVLVTNPLGEENSVMRTTMLSSMMDVLKRNASHRNEEARLFELGKVYLAEKLPAATLPLEKNTLCVGMYGVAIDFYTLKGVIERLFLVLGISDYEFKRTETFRPMHPGRTAEVFVLGKKIGVMGEMHPYVLKNYDLNTKAYAAELDFDAIAENTVFDRTYRALPKYPAVSRDIAVVLSETVPVFEIEKIIKKCSGKLLEAVKLFDVYQGNQVSEGQKSVAYSVSFRAADRTLTDDEVGNVFNKIIKTLSSELGAQLR